MSLEQTLARTNELLETLIAKINTPTGTTPPVTATADVAKPRKVKTEAAAPVEAAKPEPVKVAVEGPSFDEVKKKAVAMMEAGQDQAVVSLLAKYKAAKVSQLKPEQYAAFLADAEALTNEPAKASTDDLI